MFQKRALSLSIATVVALGASYATTAVAQGNDQIEEVVVTGIRGSLSKALDVKRDSKQIVDAIVAEDIGKFPDNNVIEALQRVTGVQVTNRGSGEVSGISIRGLSDINTTVNGRNIFTASGQAVALQDVPASLIKQVDVYKTRSASQIETGIAGSVDIKTQRPFDFDGSKVVVASRAIYQEQADKVDPNFSALASNRWDTGAGEIGALVNLSYAQTNYRDQSITAGAMVPFATATPVAPFTAYERIFLDKPGVSENPIWTPGLLNGLPNTPGSTVDVNGQPMSYLLGRDAIFSSDFTGQRERTAANISLQFAPNDSSEYTFEAFYNGYRNESFNSLLFSFADWWGSYANSPTAVADANVTLFEGTNIVKSRRVANNWSFTSGDLTTGQTDSFVYSLGGSWDLSDKLTVKSELVYQDSGFKSDFFAMRYENGRYGLNVDFNAGGGIPGFSFIDNPATVLNEADVADTANWNSAQLYDSANNNEGGATTFTTDAAYEADLGIFKQFNVGVRVDQRTATEAFSRQDGFNSAIALTPELTYINSGFYDGNADVPTTWAVANGYYIRAHADEMRAAYNLNKLALIESFNIDELTTSAYVTAGYETEIAGKVLDGEIGFRYTGSETDMEFTDTSSVNKDVYADSASTSKVLPSLTMRYALTDELFARFAYTETLRRPNFSSLNSQVVYNEDVTNIGYGTAGGGNPELKPTESKNYDLSLEWHFGDSSSLYGTLFQRDIEGFVIDFRRQVQAPKADGSGIGTYVLSQPYNASNGQLQGAELGAVWFPDNLPGLLDGFGVQASYTILNSEQSTPMTDSKGVVTGTKNTSLFGVSDNSYSLVLAYEKDKLGARLSYAWRSKFLNNYEAALFANPLEVWRKPESSMDLQITYDVTDSLSLTLDGTNLTEEIYQSYYGDNSTIGNFGSSLYSRTIALGARVTF